jgi:hypothetical protein
MRAADPQAAVETILRAISDGRRAADGHDGRLRVQ